MIKNDSIQNSGSYLRLEYVRHQVLFSAQPVIIQRFLEKQAAHLAQPVINDDLQVHFSLPDRVVGKPPSNAEMAAMLVPGEIRSQTVGGWLRYFQKHDLGEELRTRLYSLEQSPDQAINTSASLLRYAIATHMIHNMLPSGRSISYRANGDDQIPTIPVETRGASGSAITASQDAIVEQNLPETGRGTLQVPFVPAAQRFFLPQWVAFGADGSLLVNSLSEAESSLLSMRRYVSILHKASSLAPYILADEEYQLKRYGIIGQIINQGRALAHYKTIQIIKKIRVRVMQGTLNRGLSISLPYFNDQELAMAETKLDVIPAGRIKFNTVFLIRSVRLHIAKVTQDTRLNSSTRKYLLQDLGLLEQSFMKFPLPQMLKRSEKKLVIR
ncbi:MAG: hypothetical protein WCK35_14030 [Chloroflexota bacterium]